MKTVRETSKIINSDLWYSVKIVCEPGFEDIISAYIFESGFSGLNEDTAESNILLTAYFPAASENPLEKLQSKLACLKEKIHKQPWEILSVEDVPSIDWETEWRKGLSAVETGSSLVVRPSWLEYDNTESRIEIIIDPKMAFGSGSHATTFLCLEALETVDLAGMSVLDSGCGSGILSIAAVKLGARSVYGFDYDPFSVQNAGENIIINNVEGAVTIVEAELAKIQAEPFDLILANMISGILVSNLPVFRNLLKPYGRIVFSGVLEEEELDFTSSVKKAGFHPFRITRKDEWIAVYAEIKHFP